LPCRLTMSLPCVAAISHSCSQTLCVRVRVFAFVCVCVCVCVLLVGSVGM
jgi:Ca2+/H+ antiporter